MDGKVEKGVGSLWRAYLVYKLAEIIPVVDTTKDSYARIVLLSFPVDVLVGIYIEVRQSQRQSRAQHRKIYACLDPHGIFVYEKCGTWLGGVATPIVLG